MSFRKRYGFRRYVASFFEQDGTQSPHGQPDYTDPATWVPTVADWPCELVAASGGETLRGLQVAAETTHVLFGEFYGANGVTPSQRCQVNGGVFNVVAVLDKDGTQTERRIEVRQEVDS